MAECLECLDNLTDEEILRLVAICNASGERISWRTKEVSYDGDCIECSRYTTKSELLRNSLWCDEDGVFYIQIVIYERTDLTDCFSCTDNFTLDELYNLLAVCNEEGKVAWKAVEVDYESDCLDCSQYESSEDIIRKAVLCDSNGVFFIPITSNENLNEMAECFPCDSSYLTPEDMLKSSVKCSASGVALEVQNDSPE